MSTPKSSTNLDNEGSKTGKKETTSPTTASFSPTETNESSKRTPSNLESEEVKKAGSNACRNLLVGVVLVVLLAGVSYYVFKSGKPINETFTTTTKTLTTLSNSTGPSTSLDNRTEPSTSLDNSTELTTLKLRTTNSKITKKVNSLNDEDKNNRVFRTTRIPKPLTRLSTQASNVEVISMKATTNAKRGAGTNANTNESTTKSNNKNVTID